MKESLLSFEEKQNTPWFTYIQIASKCIKSFKTNSLNIIFWRFQ